MAFARASPLQGTRNHGLPLGFNSMRVISGKFRGRKLRGPRGLQQRPTSDRLRETLFDILGPAVSGTVLLDVFAGTGAVGLEALSRGAREVVFIESSAEASDLIRKNLELCGVTTAYRIIQRDVFAALRALGRQGFRADTIFLDPPYEWQTYRDLLETVFSVGLVDRESRVIVEHHCKAALPGTAERFERTRIVRQSDKCLSFYANPEDDCGLF
jgi:16S rRNA (guanine966-N2)-methyltransferase